MRRGSVGDASEDTDGARVFLEDLESGVTCKVFFFFRVCDVACMHLVVDVEDVPKIVKGSFHPLFFFLSSHAPKTR